MILMYTSAIKHFRSKSAASDLKKVQTQPYRRMYHWYDLFVCPYLTKYTNKLKMMHTGSNMFICIHIFEMFLTFFKIFVDTRILKKHICIQINIWL